MSLYFIKFSTEVNQSGKTEQPSDRLTLVSLSRAPGDADSYEQVVGGTGTQAGPEASESFVGCEIFVWKDAWSNWCSLAQWFFSRFFWASSHKINIHSGDIQIPSQLFSSHSMFVGD